MSRRSEFIAGLGATPLALGATARRPSLRDSRLDGALVLAGGGAKGAYEAGVVEALRTATGVRDGEPIPGVDVICGTSIGALNGWFVATGQYSRLAELWHDVASQRVFQLKRKFAATTRPDAPILTKIIQGLSMARGITTNVEGILDGGVIEQWISTHVDPRTRVLVPYCFTVTNLDKSRAELMFRVPSEPSDERRSKVLERIRSSVGSNVRAGLVSDDLLRSALRATASIPVLWDPVLMTCPEGSTDQYVDGGVSDNDPIDVGRALARRVNTVLANPSESAPERYNNALSIAVGAFGVAQSRIFAASLRSAYVETQAKRLLLDAAVTREQQRFLDSMLDVDLFVIRPQTELALQTVDFDQQDKINAAYQQGLTDGARGWESYAPPEA